MRGHIHRTVTVHLNTRATVADMIAALSDLPPSV